MVASALTQISHGSERANTPSTVQQSLARQVERSISEQISKEIKQVLPPISNDVDSAQIHVKTHAKLRQTSQMFSNLNAGTSAVAREQNGWHIESVQAKVTLSSHHIYSTATLSKLKNHLENFLNRRGYQKADSESKDTWKPQASIVIEHQTMLSPMWWKKSHFWLVGIAACSLFCFLFLIMKPLLLPGSLKRKYSRQHVRPSGYKNKFKPYALTQPDFKLAPTMGSWHIRSLASAPDPVIKELFQELPIQSALALLQQVPKDEQSKVIQKIGLAIGIRKQIQNELLDLTESEHLAVKKPRTRDAKSVRLKLEQCTPPLWR